MTTINETILSIVNEKHNSQYLLDYAESYLDINFKEINPELKNNLIKKLKLAIKDNEIISENDINSFIDYFVEKSK